MSAILLLEDDPILAKEIRAYLVSKSLACESVFDGELFLRALKRNTFDLYLLDINVPKVNGLEICKLIRASNSSVPILMLTAYGDLNDKRDAFALGADDYLVKPFHLEELYIRILALFRRSQQPLLHDEIIVIEDLEINVTANTVFRAGQPIKLTQKEYQILVLLAKSNGRILSKQHIAERIWDAQYDTNLNTIEVYINFLRNKIDKQFPVKLIHTKPGFGYYLQTEK
ncbi:MAG: DNA-binding response regulator [Flavobacterium sp. BFFFF2]|nr:MAG: DNA-binding response regulator [Flavobacterium sp. BFFFF2]